MSIEWSKTPCCHSSCFVLNPGLLTVLTPKRKCRHAKEVINYYSWKFGKRPDWKKDCIILVTVSIPWAWPPSLNEFNQTDNELTKANPVILSELHIMPIITVRKRSCGKVMFLHLSVSHSVHGGVGGVCLSACWDTPPWVDTPAGQTPPPPRADTWLLQRMVHILLECLLQRTVRILLERFLLLPTNEVAGRQCFYRCLWFCSWGGAPGGMPGFRRVTGPGVVPGLGGSAPGGCLLLGVPGPGGVCSRGGA